MLQMPGAVLQCSQFLASLTNPPNPPSPLSSPSAPPTVPSASSTTKPIVVKPIASRGVPLLPSPDLHTTPSFLRPHLASFYSDWFLRYSTFSTIARSSLAESQENETAGPSSSRRREEPGWNFFFFAIRNFQFRILRWCEPEDFQHAAWKLKQLQLVGHRLL